MASSSASRVFGTPANLNGEDAPEDTLSPANSEIDRDLLPPRLFATDRYPLHGRINSYSKPEYLLDLVEVLAGTPELEWLKSSCFGGLFRLPVQKSSISGKLVHQILCRSLVTDKLHEMWFVFGGRPIRFSLREFGILTGLNCGEYPSRQAIRKMLTPAKKNEKYLHKLIGPNNTYTIPEVINILREDKDAEEAEKMDSDRRKRLALVVIVDGIVACDTSKVVATVEISEMLKDLDAFMQYPWGRKSFELTLEMAKVGKKNRNVNVLAEKLSQSHTATHGLTISFQLLILQAVPLLQQFLPDLDPNATFSDRPVSHLTLCKTFHNSNILQVEMDPNLQVESILHTEDPQDIQDYSWADEVEDDGVDYIVNNLKDGHTFNKDDWHGGFDDLPLLSLPVKAKVKKAPSKRVKKSVFQKHSKSKFDDPNIEESMFSSGTMVEVSSKTDNMEIVWVPAMFIKEDDGKKNYLVKFCNKPLSFKDNKERPNVTVDSHSVRPTPPPFVVEEYTLLDSVEAFRGSKWHKGIVKRVVSQKWYMVSFQDTKKQLKFNHSDLRPPMDWEDGVWKTRGSPLAQGSGKKIGGSVMNGDTPSNESVSPVISSPVITSTQLKHTEAETQGKTFHKKTFQPMRNQNGLENESTREKGKPEKETTSDGKRNNSMALETRNVQTKEPLLAQGLGNEMADGLLNGYTLDITPQVDSPGKTSNKKTLEPLRNGNESTQEKMPEEHNSEDTSRKRKRGELEHNSDLNETVLSSDRTPNVMKSFAAADDERTKAEDATMVLPFAKKSPVWQTYESMEVFKRVPQSPHFSPLFETKEDFREGFALGMMVTFSGVLEKVKDLKTEVPLSQLNSLKDSFTELKKHGFNVTTPLSRINKLLALKDRQVNILKELEGFDKDMTDESSEKRKAEEEFSEMERKILEVKHKILELQRQEAALEKQKDATYENICQMESRARDLGVELEDVEFEFETILSAPW